MKGEDPFLFVSFPLLASCYFFPFRFWRADNQFESPIEVFRLRPRLSSRLPVSLVKSSVRVWRGDKRPQMWSGRLKVTAAVAVRRGNQKTFRLKVQDKTK